MVRSFYLCREFLIRDDKRPTTKLVSATGEIISLYYLVYVYHIISHHWLLMPSGQTHKQTHRHTHIPMCEPKQFQETRHARPLAVRAWFKIKSLKILGGRKGFQKQPMKSMKTEATENLHRESTLNKDTNSIT